jgi:replicative DNA helicase
MTETNDRTPPADNAAEMSVLGAMMLSPTAFDDVTDILTSSDFYRPTHEAIYTALLALHKRGEPVDATTAKSELQHRGELAQVGGAPYLHDCLETVPTAANAAYYARIVSRLAARRRLIAAGTRITQMGYMTGGGDVDTLIEEARTEVDACSHSIAELHLIGDDLGKTIVRLSEPDNAYPTPWSDLNFLIGGLRPGGLYIVGARPGVGKSLMANGLVMALAKHGGVAFNSLEMSNHEVYERMLSAVSNVPYARFVARKLEPADYQRLDEHVGDLEALPISVDDRAAVTVTDIRSHARTMARRGPLAGIVVDFLQLMSTPRGDRRPRHEIVGEMSRSLKILARELDVPVVALSQLNRGSTSRADQRPTMADLRESGSLEQDANVIILLHVEEDDPTTMQVAVAKNRSGLTGPLKLARRGEFARLDNYQRAPYGTY